MLSFSWWPEEPCSHFILLVIYSWGCGVSNAFEKVERYAEDCGLVSYMGRETMPYTNSYFWEFGVVQLTRLKPGRTENHANPVAVAMQDEIWLGFKYFSDRYSCILGTSGLAIFQKMGTVFQH